MSRKTTDDQIIVMALVQLSMEFEDNDPELAKRAWNLAVARARNHGMTPAELVEKDSRRDSGMHIN